MTLRGSRTRTDTLARASPLGWQGRSAGYSPAPWHCLYFLPLPHGHGSLRPTFGTSRRTGCGRPAAAAAGRAGDAGDGILLVGRRRVVVRRHLAVLRLHALGRQRRRRRRRHGQLGAEVELHRVVLDGVHQVLEEPEALLLVLEQRIALAVGAQADAAAQHDQLVEVVAPLLVEDPQQDEALELLAQRRAEPLDLARAGLAGRLEQSLAAAPS